MKRTVFGILGGLCGVLLIAGWTVFSNEHILRNGQVAYLELAPVDPRSLMQGDYMALRYALESKAAKHINADDGDAYLIVRLDEKGVASFLRVANALPSGALAANELAIHYRIRQGRMKLATNAFFFQEGTADRYEHARYGEFRIGQNGEPRLVAMRDEKLQRLGENRY